MARLSDSAPRVATVVSLLGIRHTVVGFTTDARGRYVEVAACGREILVAVQESPDTIECALCHEAEAR